MNHIVCRCYSIIAFRKKRSVIIIHHGKRVAVAIFRIPYLLLVSSLVVTFLELLYVELL